MVKGQSAQRFRKAGRADLDAILAIFARARKLMAANGNPMQWGTSWPPVELLEQDIDRSRAWLLVDDDGEGGAERILAYFALCEGAEPTYAKIDGHWLDDDEYVTMHRLAASGLRPHIAKTCLDWAVARCGNLRCDTHPANAAMRHIFTTDGFTYCGLIKVVNNVTVEPDTRVAYQRHELAGA
ncbi:N-acetyltransferase [Bifidobacterium sp. ESL0763]|uniref:N-acetyltransferase n=1 Tax=Bifidobacterium sp. ESL0763 TaxID=2983227 RepID=UPI0023FA290C|nr:N-acetyltransferase [Bifidobacterium sp. ESL0763]MDF7663616.1 N-acetyltransferase [Bifidobacterium sp. ESL0763]